MTATPPFVVAYPLAAMPARFALERGDWAAAAQLPPPAGGLPYTQALSWYAKALGAARSGQPAVAEQAAAELATRQQALTAAGNAYWAREVEIQQRAATAWIAFARKDSDDGAAADAGSRRPGRPQREAHRHAGPHPAGARAAGRHAAGSRPAGRGAARNTRRRSSASRTASAASPARRARRQRRAMRRRRRGTTASCWCWPRPPTRSGRRSCRRRPSWRSKAGRGGKSVPSPNPPFWVGRRRAAGADSQK